MCGGEVVVAVLLTILGMVVLIGLLADPPGKERASVDGEAGPHQMSFDDLIADMECESEEYLRDLRQTLAREG